MIHTYYQNAHVCEKQGSVWRGARCSSAIHRGVPRCEQPEFVPLAGGEIPHNEGNGDGGEKSPVILAGPPSTSLCGHLGSDHALD